MRPAYSGDEAYCPLPSPKRKSKTIKTKIEGVVIETTRKVKYRVTDMFGIAEEGDIREAFIIALEGKKALLYHPAEKGESPSFEICECKAKGIYEACDSEPYVNVNKRTKSVWIDENEKM